MTSGAAVSNSGEAVSFLSHVKAAKEMCDPPGQLSSMRQLSDPDSFVPTPLSQPEVSLGQGLRERVSWRVTCWLSMFHCGSDTSHLPLQDNGQN